MHEEKKENLVIDVQNLLQKKLGKKSKYIPSPLVSALKRLIHQDQVNDFLTQAKDLQGVPWLEACLTYLQANIIVKGTENLPSADTLKRYTFVSNHPLGGLDGVALGAILGKHFNGNIKFLVNDLLMNLPGLAPLCVPVNITGSQNKNFPALINALFASNDHVIMFPARLCSRKRNGIIADLPWQKAFITKSIETKRDIIPIHFYGENSSFFYTLEQICYKLGLKVNLAMLFLVDELYKNMGKTFEIHIGKPISYQTFNTTKTPKEWANEVRSLVYQL